MLGQKKISFNIDSGLHEEVIKIMNSEPRLNQTEALNHLISDGLKLRSEVENQKHLFELTSLKTLYFMREIARTRGEPFLNQVDRDFSEELEGLRESIIKHGIDYVR